MNDLIKPVCKYLRTIKEQHGSLLGLSVISVFFIFLIVVLFWSLNQYWSKTLQPRLFLAAQTQASILAESQSNTFVDVLSNMDASQLHDTLLDAVHQALIVEDPAIGERFIRKLSFEFDYSAIPVEQGSLDFVEGSAECAACFDAEVPLISRHGEILGVVSYLISDGYFRSLSDEMKSKLFAESSVGLGLIVAVWVFMLLMFHRLYNAKSAIETSDRAKTLFMANVTHELRTPLNSILGYTQLYSEDNSLMQTHGQGIDAIDRSAKHLLLMINDILEFSKGDSESLSLINEDIDFNQFLKALVDMISLRAQLQHLVFDHHFDEHLPKVIIGDEKRIRQILLNLLGNAVKFTNEGFVSFKVTRLDAHTNQDHALIRFEVEDSGIGVDKKQLKSIFVPFYQLDNARNRAEGSGLGLTISQRLVRLMDSEIRVESRSGEGSRFRFDLRVDCKSTSDVIKPLHAESADGVEQSELVIPHKEYLDTLREQARRHNILGIHNVIAQIDGEGCYKEFLKKIQPFIKYYKFKQMVIWLDEHSDINKVSPSPEESGK